MARGRPQSDLQKHRRQALDDKGSRLQGIKKERVQTAVRRSVRLAKERGLHEQILYKDTKSKGQEPFFSANSSLELSHSRQQARGQKRKRSQEAENRLHVQRTQPEKRARASPVHSSTEDTLDEEVADRTRGGKPNPIDCWRETGSWPKGYFEQDINMSFPLARTKSSSSTRSKRPKSISTPSDQNPREEKSALYNHARYEIVLKTKGSFMAKHEDGIKKESKDFYLTLLNTEQKVPEDSLFDDDIFEETCEAIQAKNEARVVRDISLLIVPSAETLARRRPKHEKILIESVNEGWNSSIPLTGSRPQPDYSVGFRREAFTKDQLNKLRPFVGDVEDDYTSFFMGTYYMYFPFLTCEVKCGTQALEIADRQNAHSMTLAVRGIVELFRVVNREKELDREILAFSVSHDHGSVRIYGHYPIINGKDTTYYRHPIRKFDFTELDGKDKWTAYKFTKNIYGIWVQRHFNRIRSVIDQIPPDLNFEVSREPQLQLSEGTGSFGLPRKLENHHLSQRSNTDSISLSQGDGSQPGPSAQVVTPDTSVSQKTEKQFKVPKKKHAAG